MKTEIIIKGFIPTDNTLLSESINETHKEVLYNMFGFVAPSNNKEWIKDNNNNIIAFYAHEKYSNEILCAYRHEFISNKDEIYKTPFISGVDITENKLLINRLSEIANLGMYSETCAFWCPKEMKYKESLLSKFLFTYGIITSFLNGSVTVVGLAPDKLLNYYSNYGLYLDEKITDIIYYSKHRYPSYFVNFDKSRENKELFKVVNDSIYNDSAIQLKPYKNCLLTFEKPLIMY